MPDENPRSTVECAIKILKNREDGTGLFYDDEMYATSHIKEMAKTYLALDYILTSGQLPLELKEIINGG